MGDPLELYATRVRPEWIDYNGHMSEAFYVLVFGYATDRLLDVVGMDQTYRRRTGMSLYTIEAHLTYLQELGEDEPVTVTTRLLDVDRKRVRLFHSMQHAERGDVVATEELLLCNVDGRVRRSAPLPEGVAASLRALLDAHRDLPLDERVGRAIALPAPPRPASDRGDRGRPGE